MGENGFLADAVSSAAVLPAVWRGLRFYRGKAIWCAADPCAGNILLTRLIVNEASSGARLAQHFRVLGNSILSCLGVTVAIHACYKSGYAVDSLSSGVSGAKRQ